MTRNDDFARLDRGDLVDPIGLRRGQPRTPNLGSPLMERLRRDHGLPDAGGTAESFAVSYAATAADDAAAALAAHELTLHGGSLAHVALALTTDQTIPTSSTVPVAWDAIEADTAGAWTALFPSRIIFPATGLYLYGAVLGLDGTFGSGVAAVTVRLNGTDIGSVGASGHTGMRAFTAGDFIEVVIATTVAAVDVTATLSRFFAVAL